MPYYTINGITGFVDKSILNDFLKLNPNAIKSYKVSSGGQTGFIDESELKSFLETMPDAELDIDEKQRKEYEKKYKGYTSDPIITAMTGPEATAVMENVDRSNDPDYDDWVRFNNIKNTIKYAKKNSKYINALMSGMLMPAAGSKLIAGIENANPIDKDYFDAYSIYTQEMQKPTDNISQFTDLFHDIPGDERTKTEKWGDFADYLIRQTIQMMPLSTLAMVTTLGAAEFIPAVAPGLAARAATSRGARIFSDILAQEIGAAAMLPISMGVKRATLEEQAPWMSESDRFWNSLVTGLTEWQTEALLGPGAQTMAWKAGIPKYIEKGILKSSGNQLGKAAIKSIGWDVFKRYTGSILEEGAEEGVAQLIENVADLWTGYSTDPNIMRGVIDAAAIGALATFISPESAYGGLSSLNNVRNLSKSIHNYNQIKSQILEQYPEENAPERQLIEWLDKYQDAIRAHNVEEATEARAYYQHYASGREGEIPESILTPANAMFAAADHIFEKLSSGDEREQAKATIEANWLGSKNYEQDQPYVYSVDSVEFDPKQKLDINKKIAEFNKVVNVENDEYNPVRAVELAHQIKQIAGQPMPQLDQALQMMQYRLGMAAEGVRTNYRHITQKNVRGEVQTEGDLDHLHLDDLTSPYNYKHILTNPEKLPYLEQILRSGNIFAYLTRSVFTLLDKAIEIYNLEKNEYKLKYEEAKESKDSAYLKKLDKEYLPKLDLLYNRAKFFEKNAMLYLAGQDLYDIPERLRLPRKKEVNLAKEMEQAVPGNAEKELKEYEEATKLAEQERVLQKMKDKGIYDVQDVTVGESNVPNALKIPYIRKEYKKLNWWEKNKSSIRIGAKQEIRGSLTLVYNTEGENKGQVIKAIIDEPGVHEEKEITEGFNINEWDTKAGPYMPINAKPDLSRLEEIVNKSKEKRTKAQQATTTKPAQKPEETKPKEEEEKQPEPEPEIEIEEAPKIEIVNPDNMAINEIIVRDENDQKKILKNIPLGNKNESYDNDLNIVNTQFALVPLKDIIISNNPETYSLNKEYPEILQPRERDRVDLINQVREIVARLKPDLLTADRYAKDGAPIVLVDKNGRIIAISGNGRLMAMNIKTERNEMSEYEQYIKDHLSEFGLEDQDTKGKVLVRIYQGYADVVELARNLNQGRQSEIEVAVDDAKRMLRMRAQNSEELDNLLSLIREDQEILDNPAFVNKYAEMFLKPEESQYISKGGSYLTPMMANRIQYALMLYIFNNDPRIKNIIEMYIETGNTSVKSIMQGIINNLSTITRFREYVIKNDLYNLDLSEDLAKALGIINDLRLRNIKFESVYEEQDIFESGNKAYEDYMVDLIRTLLKFRFPAQATAFIKSYYESAKEALDPDQLFVPGIKEIVTSRTKFIQEFIEAWEEANVEERERKRQEREAKRKREQQAQLLTTINETHYKTEPFESADVATLVNENKQDYPELTEALFQAEPFSLQKPNGITQEQHIDNLKDRAYKILKQADGFTAKLKTLMGKQDVRTNEVLLRDIQDLNDRLAKITTLATEILKTMHLNTGGIYDLIFDQLKPVARNESDELLTQLFGNIRSVVNIEKTTKNATTKITLSFKNGAKRVIQINHLRDVVTTYEYDQKGNRIEVLSAGTTQQGNRVGIDVLINIADYYNRGNFAAFHESWHALRMMLKDTPEFVKLDNYVRNMIEDLQRIGYYQMDKNYTGPGAYAKKYLQKLTGNVIYTKIRNGQSLTTAEMNELIEEIEADFLARTSALKTVTPEVKGVIGLIKKFFRFLADTYRRIFGNNLKSILYDNAEMELEALFAEAFLNSENWTPQAVEQLDPAIKNLFVGIKAAENYDQLYNTHEMMNNLELAKQYESEGMEAKKIKLLTGWERGVDGQWMWEYNELRDVAEDVLRNIEAHFFPSQYNWVDLKEVFDDALLRALYPKLETLRTTRAYIDFNTEAFFSDTLNAIVFGSNPENIVATLMHELQHFIQMEEGWPLGASSKIAWDIANEEQRAELAKEAVKEIQRYLDFDIKELKKKERILDLLNEIKEILDKEELDKLEAMALDYSLKWKAFDDYRSKKWSEQDPNYNSTMDEETQRLYKEHRKAGEDAYDYINEVYSKKKGVKPKIQKDEISDLIFYNRQDMFEEGVIGGKIKALNNDIQYYQNRINELQQGYNIVNNNEKDKPEYEKLIKHYATNGLYLIYKRVTGEVQARNAGRRVSMSEEERRKTLAEETEDVARKDQIILMSLENPNPATIKYMNVFRLGQELLDLFNGPVDLFGEILNQADIWYKRNALKYPDKRIAILGELPENYLKTPEQFTQIPGVKSAQEVRGKNFIINYNENNYIANNAFALPLVEGVKSTKEQVMDFKFIHSVLPTVGDKVHEVRMIRDILIKIYGNNIGEQYDVIFEPYGASGIFPLNIEFLYNTTLPYYFNVSIVFAKDKYLFYKAIKENNRAIIDEFIRGLSAKSREEAQAIVKTDFLRNVLGLNGPNKRAYDDGLWFTCNNTRRQYALQHLPFLIEFLQKPNVHLTGLVDNEVWEQVHKEIANGKRVFYLDDSDYPKYNNELPTSAYRGMINNAKFRATAYLNNLLYARARAEIKELEEIDKQIAKLIDLIGLNDPELLNNYVPSFRDNLPTTLLINKMHIIDPILKNNGTVVMTNAVNQILTSGLINRYGNNAKLYGYIRSGRPSKDVRINQWSSKEAPDFLGIFKNDIGANYLIVDHRRAIPRLVKYNEKLPTYNAREEYENYLREETSKQNKRGREANQALPETNRPLISFMRINDVYYAEDNKKAYWDNNEPLVSLSPEAVKNALTNIMKEAVPDIKKDDLEFEIELILQYLYEESSIKAATWIDGRIETITGVWAKKYPGYFSAVPELEYIVPGLKAVKKYIIDHLVTIKTPEQPPEAGIIEKEPIPLPMPPEKEPPVKYMKLNDYNPTKTKEVYKLVRKVKDKNGEYIPGRYTSLFIGKEEWDTGQWYRAENNPTPSFAERPGFHSGEIPDAPWLKKTSTGEYAEDRVWVKGRVADMVDWQTIAHNQGLSPTKKEIKNQVPINGYYRYPKKFDGKWYTWIISGEFIIDKELTPEEAEEITRKNKVNLPTEAPKYLRTEADIDKSYDKVMSELARVGTRAEMYEKISNDTNVAYREIQEKFGRMFDRTLKTQPPKLADLLKSYHLNDAVKLIEQNKPDDPTSMRLSHDEALELMNTMMFSDRQWDVWGKDAYSMAIAAMQLQANANYYGMMALSIMKQIPEKMPARNTKEYADAQLWIRSAKIALHQFRKSMRKRQAILSAAGRTLNYARKPMFDPMRIKKWSERAQYMALDNEDQAKYSIEANRAAIAELQKEIDIINEKISQQRKENPLSEQIFYLQELLNEKNGQIEDLKSRIELAKGQMDENYEDIPDQEVLQIAKKVKKEEPGTLENAVELLKEAMKADYMDAITATYYAFILSGPTTHAKNIVDTAVNSLLTLIVGMLTNPKAAPGMLFAPFSANPQAGETIVTPEGEKIKMPKTNLGLAIQNAARQFSESEWAVNTKYGYDNRRLNENIWGKIVKVMNFVGRTMAAEDAFMYTIIRSSIMYSLAVTESKKTGRSVKDLLKYPTKNMLKQAEYESRRACYNQEPEGIVGIVIDAIANFMNDLKFSHPYLGYAAINIVPFTRIVGNVLNAGIDWTPVGAYRALQYKQGVAKHQLQLYEDTTPYAMRDFAQQMTRVVLGTFGMALLYFFGRGLLTGAGPDDKEKRDQLRLKGWRPYSIKIGDKYIPYQYLGGMALPLSLIGNVFDQELYTTAYNKKDTFNLILWSTMGISRTILDKSFLSGVSDALQALNYQDENWLKKYMVGMATNPLVPNLFKQLDNLKDPTIRKPESLIEYFMVNTRPVSRLFGYNDINKDIDMFGNPRKRDTGIGAFFGYPVGRPQQLIEMNGIDLAQVVNYLNEMNIFIPLGSEPLDIEIAKDMKIEMTQTMFRDYQILRGKFLQIEMLEHYDEIELYYFMGDRESMQKLANRMARRARENALTMLGDVRYSNE